MQKFRFALESVRQWRRVRAELEEAKLHELLAGLERMGQAAQGLEQMRLDAEQTVFSASTVASEQLVRLDAYRRHLQAQRVSLEAKRRERRQAIAEQQGRVLEARRALRLLEKLRERQLANWQVEVDRELEAMIAEVYLARQGRRVLAAGS
jgi:flagellar biosynthesis chaperone FliJ